MDAALVAGISENQIIHMKQEFVTERIKDSIDRNGTSPKRFVDVMISAISVLKTRINHFLNVLFEKEDHEKEKNCEPEKAIETETVDIKIEIKKVELELRRLEQISTKLNKKYKIILALEKWIEYLQGEYDEVKDSIILHARKKRELQTEIGAKQIELNKIKDEYKQFPKLYGFKSVKAFYQTYKQTQADLERLQKEAQDQGNEKSDFTGEEHPTAKDTGKKKSIHDRLAENKKAMEDKQSFSKSPKVKKSRVEEL